MDVTKLPGIRIKTEIVRNLFLILIYILVIVAGVKYVFFS